MGDVIHTIPMVNEIRRHFPDAVIDWVVEEAYVSLVRLSAQVRKVLPLALRRWRKRLWSKATRAEIAAFVAELRSESYDLVFDPQGLFKTGAVMGLARLAPGGQKVGLANATDGSGYEAISRLFHSISVPVGRQTHAVLRARQLAAAGLVYAVDGPAQFDLRLPHMALLQWQPKLPYAVFFHATARAEKRWAVANWVAVAQELERSAMPILLPWGSADEQQAAQQLAAQMPNAQVLPKLAMMEAVALAQGASLAIGVDTGLTHIAAAFNRPTIELYCDSPRWKTEGNWSPNIINLGDNGHPPSVPEVTAAIAALLAAVKPEIAHATADS